MPTLDRRQTLALIAAGTVGACATPQASPIAPASSAIFAHGVASGDPQNDSVVLWTRVTTASEAEPVSWVLARDPDFTDIVLQGETIASAAADHTVKVIPDGLAPGATYYYRFTAVGETSPAGRTKTLPAGSLDRLGIALVSCSNYPFGHFNAYDVIARDEAVDIVLHTGDYIYEYGADSWGAETGPIMNGCRSASPSRASTARNSGALMCSATSRRW